MELDLFVFIVGSLLLLAWFMYKQNMFSRPKKGQTSMFSLEKFPNVRVSFHSKLNFIPTSSEYTLTQKLFEAALKAWPDMQSNLMDVSYRVWFVRHKDQTVIYRTGVRLWSEIPALVGIEESQEGEGFGGMSDRIYPTVGDIYIATYHENRSVEALLIHEITHCVKPIRGHTEEFYQYENVLRDEVNKAP